MSKKLVVGVYDDEHSLIVAIKHIRAKKIKINNVYTPYPIHGLDHALGMRRSKLPKFTFWVGATGFTSATLMQVGLHTFTLPFNLMNPINVGGKPWGFAGLPAFVPIMFEIMVLSSALSIVAGFLFRSKLFPSLSCNVVDIRATDDKMILVIDLEDVPMDAHAVNQLLKETPATEVYEKEVAL